MRQGFLRPRLGPRALLAILAAAIVLSGACEIRPAPQPSAIPELLPTPIPARPTIAIKPTEQPPLRIAFLVGTVPAAASGELESVAAAQAYASWQNATGGLKGRTIQVDRVDIRGEMPVAVDTYKRLRQEDVRFVVLPSPRVTDALSAMLKADVMLTITYACDSLWADAKLNPSMYTICTSYDDQMLDALQYVRQAWHDVKPPKIAFLFVDNILGRSTFGTGKEAADKLGFEIVGEEPLAPEAEDAIPQALRLKRAAPDFVIVHAPADEMVVVLRDLGQQAMSTRVIGLNFAFEDAIVKAVASQQEFIGLAPMTYPGSEVPVVQEMKEHWPELSRPPGLKAIAGWTLMKVIQAALLKNPGLDSQALQAAFEQLGDVDVGQATIEWQYSTTRHSPTEKVLAYTVREGKIQTEPVALQPVKP